MNSNETGGEIARALVADMVRLTNDRIGNDCIENARRNQAVLDKGQSLATLRSDIVDFNSAIVIAAGPSIRRHDPIRAILEAGYRGAIVCTESAIRYCLSNDVVPDLIVTLDPHATRIVRWFGDPDLTSERLAEDDYYRRQDMDEDFAAELRTNEEVLRLLDRHGKDMRIALSTSASAAVVDRVIGTGMQIYWWNPMLDDPDGPDSRSRELFDLNGLPCVNAGGNVGAACWMMADAALEIPNVALTGMDFSYYDDTPYRATQYYHEAVALVGEDALDKMFIRVHNPYLDKWFFTDPAYYWYRESFLEMVAEGECHTYNCTQGGILFGDGIDFVPLANFLAEHATNRKSAANA
jgi:hypothetical protein